MEKYHILWRCDDCNTVGYVPCQLDSCSCTVYTPIGGDRYKCVKCGTQLGNVYELVEGEIVSYHPSGIPFRKLLNRYNWDYKVGGGIIGSHYLMEKWRDADNSPKCPNQGKNKSVRVYSIRKAGAFSGMPPIILKILAVLTVWLSFGMVHIHPLLGLLLAVISALCFFGQKGKTVFSLLVFLVSIFSVAYSTLHLMGLPHLITQLFS